MKEIYCVDDIAAEAPYGLAIPTEECVFPKLDNYPNVSALIKKVKDSEPGTLEALANTLSKKVNQNMCYYKKGFQDRSQPLQSIEDDPVLSLDYAEKVLCQGYGRCEDAGFVTRTILKNILPKEFKVLGLMIDSQAYDGFHDITLVYSEQGKIFLDSIKYEGHKGGLFSEETCPVETVKQSDYF